MIELLAAIPGRCQVSSLATGYLLSGRTFSWAPLEYPSQELDFAGFATGTDYHADPFPPENRAVFLATTAGYATVCQRTAAWGALELAPAAS